MHVIVGVPHSSSIVEKTRACKSEEHQNNFCRATHLRVSRSELGKGGKGMQTQCRYLFMPKSHFLGKGKFRVFMHEPDLGSSLSTIEHIRDLRDLLGQLKLSTIESKIQKWILRLQLNAT